MRLVQFISLSTLGYGLTIINLTRHVYRKMPLSLLLILTWRFRTEHIPHISSRDVGWTASFFEDFKCSIIRKNPEFPGKASTSAVVTQDCTPFPNFASGLPKSVRWNPGNGFGLLVYSDMSCLSKPAFQLSGCIDLVSSGLGGKGSAGVVAFSIINASTLSTLWKGVCTSDIVPASYLSLHIVSTFRNMGYCPAWAFISNYLAN